MNAETIINTLGGNIKTGMCCCPAHDDRNPSLSVKEGDNGKPLVKCFAGCSQEAVIASLKDRGAWCSDGAQQLSTTDYTAHKKALEQRKMERVAEEKAQHEKASVKAERILQNAQADPTQHPYYIKKGVSLGTRIKRGDWPQDSYKDPKWKDALLIPLYDTQRKTWTISAICSDGSEKKYLQDARKQGCFHPIGKITGTAGTIAIGEGIATVAAVCQTMDCPGVAAMDAANLIPVAREIRKIAPDADIVIIADDDQKPSSGDNPGKAAAMDAALAIKGKVAIPELEKKADAWDVWHEQGPEGIKAMMAAATVATVATVAVANDILPRSTVGCDLDLKPEDIQLLRGALTVVPAGAMMGRHKAEEVIGWGLRHNNSGIHTEVGAALCLEWDTKAGGKSLDIFTTCDPGYNLTQPVTASSIYAIAKEHGWTGQIPWPKPESLITVEKPDPYPLGALPGNIGAAVAEVVEFVQSPVALTACSALAVASTAIQGLVDVRRADRLEGPVSIFTLVLADSGERKTSSDAHFSKPIQQWEAEKAEAARPEIKKYNADIAIWDANKSGLMSAIAAASKNNKSTDGLAIQVNTLETSKPEEPKVPRLLYADATPEALAYSLAHKHPVGAVMSSEAGVVLGGHAMGKDSAMRNMGILNCFWDGAPVPIDRRSTASYTVRNVRLSMGLAVQPETIRTFLDSSKGLARGIGFLARFLIAWPESTQGKRMFKEAPKAWPELGKFHRRLGALLDYPLTYDDEGYLSTVMLELSAEAKDVWVAFHNDVEAELNPGREMAEAKDVASKAADNAARLAALFHVFEEGVEGQISIEHMNAGATIAGWHLYEARRFMGELAVDISISNAVTLDSWLIGWCKVNHVAEINRRQLQQNGPSCIRSGEKFKAALKELADAGRIRESKAGRQKTIEINPKLLED